MVARGVVTAVLSVLLVGCGGGGATEPFGSAATGSVTTSLTAAAHASDAALSIYAAWGRGDLETARFYATTEVADFLLNHPFPGDAFAFTGCLPSTEGQGREVCTFAGGTDALDMTFQPDPKGGFRAVGARFYEKTSEGTAASPPSTSPVDTYVAQSPMDAAMGLFSSWASDSPDTALLFATQPAVDTLFGHPYSEPAPTFTGCEPGGGEVTCVYVDEGGAIDMVADPVGAHYRVREVTFVAD